MEGAWHHPGTEQHREHDAICRLTRAQSLGWEHYEVHEPEPHILLFKYVLCQACIKLILTNNNRRPINYQPPMH
jgi:hypothetical protein